MPRTTLVRSRPRVPRPPELQGVSLDYGSSIWQLVNGTLSDTTRQIVSDRSISGLAGCWAAVSKIANACAQMLVGAEAIGPDGRTPLATVPSVLLDPCAGYDSFSYWKEVVSTALMRGNFLGLKADHDPVTGYPRQIVPLPLDSVNARYDEAGYVVFEIAGDTYSADEVVHIRCGLSVPGQILALGVVEAHRRALQGQLDLSGMAGSVWQQGSVPSGVVTLATDNPTQEQVDAVKAAWITTHGGRRTVAVTGRSMQYTPITWSAQDAQFIESRQFSIAEAALMFGLRPEDLGASIGGSSLTYANRESDSLQRITDSYLPVALPVEQAWSRLIPGKNYVRANVEALLRSTTKERYEIHALAQSIGVETVEETREIEAKPPLPKPDPPEPPAITPADSAEVSDDETDGTP